MKVIAKKNFRKQIIKGNEYVVLEIIIDEIYKKISYRIIDEDEECGIYDSMYFDINESKLDNYFMYKYNNSIYISVISKETRTKWKNNQEGFWGALFDGDREAMTLIKELVRCL